MCLYSIFPQISQEIEPWDDRPLTTDGAIQKSWILLFHQSEPPFEEAETSTQKTIVPEPVECIPIGNSDTAAMPNPTKILVPISRFHQLHPLTTLLRTRKLFQMELGSIELCTFPFDTLFWFLHSFCCLPSGF
jgi:hypothetical protein